LGLSEAIEILGNNHPPEEWAGVLDQEILLQKMNVEVQWTQERKIWDPKILD
jgi:hypothetical protein